MYVVALWSRLSSCIMTKFKYCYNKCIKKFFGYAKYYSVTEMLLTLRLPSFDTAIHKNVCVWSKHSNDMVKLLRCVCPSAFLWVLLCFIVHRVLQFFLSFTLSTFSLYFSCLCLWAMLADLNKTIMMMMMMMMMMMSLPGFRFRFWFCLSHQAGFCQLSIAR